MAKLLPSLQSMVLVQTKVSKYMAVTELQSRIVVLIQSMLFVYIKYISSAILLYYTYMNILKALHSMA